MGIKIYNTLSRKKEEFEPLEGNEVRIYVCGITPYDYSHIGHARSCVAFDIVCRWLKKRGYNVRFVQNFTDVDDKIIAKALKEGKTYKEISQKYIDAFFKDIVEALNVEKAMVYPKVSEHINEIIELIEKIIKNGHAYVLENGDVYFHVPSFKDYGKLSKVDLEELKKHRIEPDPRKKDPRDFALWKAAKPEDFATGAVFDSPWGKGRPGWHIECSAMSMKYLGETLDIHGGGKDLIFPHHENEIAQSEAATGKTFSRFWMHNEFVNIKGEKMSKSLGNILAVRDILKKWSGEILRFFLASVHYRDPIDYDKKKLEEAAKVYGKIKNALEMLDAEINALKYGFSKEREKNKGIFEEIDSFWNRFAESMDDDFNTSKALRYLLSLISYINKYLSKEEKNIEECEFMLAKLLEMCEVFGILQSFERSESFEEDELKLIKEREEARKERKYDVADKIREELLKRGVVLFDTPNGVRFRKVKKER